MASYFDLKGTTIDSFKIGKGGPSLIRNLSNIYIDSNLIITAANQITDLLGTLPTTRGGTGSTTTSGALTNLGAMPASFRGSASGVAALDATTTVPDAQLPSTIARVASPTFTGTPAAPTAAAGTSTTQLSTTAFVTNAVSTKANIASPTFTGTPAAPTAAAGTSTTQLATTAFVQGILASPTFTGTPSAPTAAAGTSTTQLSTTAFVTNALSSYAPLASPVFTGFPVGPTAPASTNSTQLATTAYTDSAISTVNSQIYVALCVNTANQNLTNGSFTKIIFDTKTEDTSAIFSTTNSNFTFTTATAGWYQVSINAELSYATAVASEAIFIISLFINGSEYVRGYRAQTTSTNPYLAGCLSTLINVSSGTVLDARIYASQNASTITLLPNARFHIVRVKI